MGRDKGVHIFLKSISPKVNVIAWLEFKFAHHHITATTRRGLPSYGCVLLYNPHFKFTASWKLSQKKLTKPKNNVVRSSVKVPEFDKHLQKAGGHIGRNLMEITIKMKTTVRKSFPKRISVKVIMIPRLEFELVWYDVAVQHVSNYSTKTPPAIL